MMHPLLVKLGGAVVTDKNRDSRFRRAVTKRLLQEVRRADAPTILLHGAGSFGHPLAKQYGLGQGPMTDGKRDGVSRTMAAVHTLHAQVLVLAADVGLRPVSVPLHLEVELDQGALVGLPVERITDLLEEGYTPVLHGTLARDPEVGWRVVSADGLMAALAEEMEPRLAVFATDVDGVLGTDGKLLASVSSADGIQDVGDGDDVTGAMKGKVHHGLLVAQTCPTIILNGLERGRLEDALHGKEVTGTHLLAQ